VARQVLKEADVTIALGTRLRDADTKRRGVKLGRLVHIDVDSRWTGRNYRPDVAMAGHLGKAVEALRHIMKGRRSSWDMDALRGAREREEATLERASKGLQIVRLLARAVPREATTVWDLNLISYWAEIYFPARSPRSFLSPKGISPIFYAFPAAMGARLARPASPCLCVTGDGSFTGTAGEMATMRTYGIPVVVIVYNNSSFGVLEDYMRKRYGLERTMDLGNPDFCALARAFGIKAARADSLEGLERILRREVSWEEPYLIEFCYPLFPPPWE
jgi:acetolactate synthase-1/2/3 large subunit